jgi:hypothetical protein
VELLSAAYDWAAISDLPLSMAVDYLIHAQNTEKERLTWNLWARLYPFMASGWLKYKSFDEFKNAIFRRPAKLTPKTTEEIEDEMSRVIAAYEKK